MTVPPGFGTQPLRDILKELHAHLRETHKKRDQLLAFYFALLAGMFAYNGSDPSPASLAGMVFLVGLFVLWAIIQYRKWHIRFNGSFAVFEYLIAQNEAVTHESAATAWKRVNGSRSWWDLIDPAGIETATMMLAAVAVSLPLTTLLRRTVLGGSLGISWVGTVVMIGSALVLIAAVNLVVRSRAAAFQEFPAEDWMFRWLREPDSAGGGMNEQPSSAAPASK